MRGTFSHHVPKDGLVPEVFHHAGSGSRALVWQDVVPFGGADDDVVVKTLAAHGFGDAKVDSSFSCQSILEGAMHEDNPSDVFCFGGYDPQDIEVISDRIVESGRIDQLECNVANSMIFGFKVLAVLSAYDVSASSVCGGIGLGECRGSLQDSPSSLTLTSALEAALINEDLPEPVGPRMRILNRLDGGSTLVAVVT